jgi:hypothetical protein
VKLVGTIEQPGKNEVFAPVFEIERWVPRPADLPKGKYAANGSRRKPATRRPSGDLDDLNDPQSL